MIMSSRFEVVIGVLIRFGRSRYRDCFRVEYYESMEAMLGIRANILRARNGVLRSLVLDGRS